VTFMSVETVLRVSVRNQPGELARIAEQLGNAGINIRSVAGVASGSDSLMDFLVDNTAEATRIWRAAGTPYEEAQVALAWLPDTPGTLGRAGRALADAGINIESTFVGRTDSGQAQVAFGCADAQKADRILAELFQPVAR
jgi:hypothetical protein